MQKNLISNTRFELEWTLRSLYGRIRGTSRIGPRVFGVGAAKTGTHSLGQMFDNQIRSHHELDIEDLIYLHLNRVETGRNEALHRFLRRRDFFWDLKLDVSHINIFLVEDFEILFPGSLYIMTIRHPLDWLRSFIDDSLRRKTSDAFILLRDYRFDPTLKHPQEEKVLEDHGLYTVKGYLDHWRTAINGIKSKVSKDRLLIVKTEDLAPRSREIASFLGVESDIVDETKSRAFVNTQRFGLLSEIPKQYLNDLVEETCGQLLQEFF